MLAVSAGNGWSASPAADLERAEELVGQALAEAPRDWLAHYAKGAVLRRRQGKVEDAIPEFETALALNPNWLNSLNLLAQFVKSSCVVQDHDRVDRGSNPS